MKQVHVECNPDEVLVKTLGFTRKQVIHHSGKSRIFSALRISKEQLALADEDPRSPQTNDEKKLQYSDLPYGLKLATDQRGNTICLLSVKLENWILDRCKESKIDLRKYGLPADPDSLHNVINNRLDVFRKVLTDLLQVNNPGLIYLKNILV